MITDKTRPPRLQMILEESNVIYAAIATYREEYDRWHCVLRKGRKKLDERFTTDPYAELADMILAFRGRGG